MVERDPKKHNFQDLCFNVKPPSAGSPDITRIKCLKPLCEIFKKKTTVYEDRVILPGPSLPYELAISPTWHRPQRLRDKCGSHWRDLKGLFNKEWTNGKCCETICISYKYKQVLQYSSVQYLYNTLPKTNSKSTWKLMLGRRSFPLWEKTYSGAMLVSERVPKRVLQETSLWLLFRAVRLPRNVEGEVFSKLKAASVMSWISLATCNVFVVNPFFGQDFRMLTESRLHLSSIYIGTK